MADKIWRSSITVLVVFLVLMQYQTLASVRDITEKTFSERHMAADGKADDYFVLDETAYPTGNDSGTNTVAVQLSRSDIKDIAKELAVILRRDGTMTVALDATQQTKSNEENPGASLESYQESEQLVNSLAAQGSLDSTSISRFRELNSKISIEHKKQLLDKIIKMYEKNEIPADALDYILM